MIASTHPRIASCTRRRVSSTSTLPAKLTELKDPRTRNKKSWFRFVRRIIKVGRERFVAVVDPLMSKHIKHIRAHIQTYPKYKRTPAKPHHKNFPRTYEVRKSKMFSIKSTEDYGNIQLTLGPGTHPSTGESVWLLDADIDENGRLMKHFGDLIKHKFTGGTHPYDIHEYLLLTHEEIDLGYRLV